MRHLSLIHILLKGDRTGYFVCVVPGNHEVDLKAAARVSGNKKADLIPMKELLPVTGYIRGGCSGQRDKVKLIREDAQGNRQVIPLNLNDADIIVSPSAATSVRHPPNWNAMIQGY